MKILLVVLLALAGLAWLGMSYAGAGLAPRAGEAQTPQTPSAHASASKQDILPPSPPERFTVLDDQSEAAEPAPIKQPATVRIGGVVVNEHGAPMTAVRVEFRSPLESVISGKDRGFRSAVVDANGQFAVDLPTSAYDESAHYAIMGKPADGEPICHGVGYISVAPDIVLTGHSRSGEGWELTGSVRLQSSVRHKGMMLLTTARSRKNLGIMRFDGNEIDVHIQSPYSSLRSVADPVVLMIFDAETRFCLHTREFASLNECSRLLESGYEVPIFRYGLKPSVAAAGPDVGWIKIRAAATKMGGDREGSVHDGVFSFLSSAQTILVSSTGRAEDGTWVSAVQLPSHDATVPIPLGSRLPGACTLEARVLSADGAPATDARVRMQLEAELEGGTQVIHEQRGTTNEDGAVSMTGLPSGRYRARISGPGLQTRSFPWHLPSGPMLIEVAKSASVALDIRSNGQPWEASDLRLYVRTTGKEWTLRRLPTVGNDLCVVDNIPVGPVDLVLFTGEYHAHTSCELTAGLMHRVPMQLGRSRRISGQARSPDATPATGVRLHVSLAEGGMVFPRMTIDTNGAGSFAVTVPGSGLAQIAPASPTIRLDAHATESVDHLEITVRPK
ncbi:MAG: carboxypeptidase-like regulatory domain-containing protein [Planctomycetota bacterium]